MDLWYLVRKGKLPRVALSQVWSLTQYPDINVTAAAVTTRIAERSTSAPIDSLADPWDRFIVATAAVRSLPLITRDQPIAALGVVRIIW
jgi:PIN domain nuclease of toxin-antitoxin system